MLLQTVLVDIEFENTIDELMENSVVNTSIAKEHVSEIERNIHTVEESTIWIINTVNLKYLHKLLITNILYFKSYVLMTYPLKWNIGQTFTKGNRGKD